MKQDTITVVSIILLVALLLCCCCVVAGVLILGVGSFSLPFSSSPSQATLVGIAPTAASRITVTPAPLSQQPTKARSSLSTPEPGLTERPATATSSLLHAPTLTSIVAQPTNEAGPLVSVDTLTKLQDTIVPINDLADLARRFEGKENIPLTVDPPTQPFRVGDQERYWVTNVDTNLSFEVDATLEYITEHVYFWIEDGVRFDQSDLRDLVETFEKDIYPTNQEFFGSEWIPGIDNDPHLYILYATNLGFTLAGYFSSADEYSPLAHEYSNAHEMFILNADNVDLDEEFTYGVLAHEFQHMIHWYRDRNEASWLNEGFSELAALLNGYYDSGFDSEYARNPDMQLTDWPNSDDTTPHYGASFLFVTYFLDRFGDEATKALVAHPNNGMSSVDDVLTQIGAVDPLTGATIKAENLFLDWVIASYLRNSRVGDGRYAYRSYSSPPTIRPTETFTACPVNRAKRQVHQFGVDYIRFKCSGAYTLHFDGAAQVGVVPADPYSGDFAFWSNKGDESDMTLTREFDFSSISGDLEISYWTWYDLEEDYDYLYLAASEDGQRWQILDTPSGTDADPSGNSYGWGYNALSGGDDQAEWIRETVDLSQFAGKKVLLRFEYITDAAVNGEGFLLDDVAVPQAGYFTDFEQDDGGWAADGWARMQNALPQTFQLALISRGTNTTVNYITLQPDISADIPIQIGGGVDEVILVVTGVTPFTRQVASYEFEVVR